MSDIHKLIIEDVRCFAGRQEFNIRPLTFLVGENSTGKSTALGCLQALGGYTEWSGRGGIDFDVEPYQMGSFKDIVKKRGGREFRLGLEWSGKNAVIKGINITFFEEEIGSEPKIKQLKIVFEDGEIIAKLGNQESQNRHPRHFLKNIKIDTNDAKKPIFTFETNHADILEDLYLFDLFYFSNFVDTDTRKKQSPNHRKFKEFLESVTLRFPSRRRRLRHILRNISRTNVESIAPIRSKPQRTYDPVKESQNAEGSEIPTVLMNMSKKDKTKWDSMKKSLIEFGKNSGLFTDISVQNFKKSMGAPFQLEIKACGPKVNMMYVGYGISQVLPILVRVFNADKPTMFLLQQPEVHLHPKGQAELASLFIEMVEKIGHSFVLETHSDAMINRARIEIMNKRIRPEDVSLIYLEPKKTKVNVHNITFDEQGNMIGVPDGYRDFFLKETDKLLGFED